MSRLLRILSVTAFVTMFVLGGAFAQQRKITGVITDAENEPVIGATVVIKGTSTATVTGLDGDYSINAAKGDVLVISHIEMVPKEVTVGEPTVLNMVMERNVETIDEVMVVAYGTSKKTSFTGSAEVVSSDKLKSRPVTDISKSLDGQVAGVMTTSGSGQPGSGSSIVIRGFGSINASNNPLLVVDGMPYDGSLNSLNSDDIETMTVLKDASAGALYGARGANGVIMITTKSSKNDKTSVSFSAKTSVIGRAIPAYSTLNAKEYMELMYRAYYNDLLYTEGYLPEVAAQKTPALLSSEILGKNEQYNPFNLKTTELFDQNGKVVSGAKLRYDENWMDEATSTLPVRQEYQASIAGSTAKSKYLASLSYLDENGLLKTTGFTRYTGRVNLDLNPYEWVKVGVNLNYSHTDTDFLGADASSNSNVWRSAQLMAAIYPVYEKNEDGGNALDANGKKVFDYGRFRPAGAQNNKNSVATLYDDRYYNFSDNVSARTYLSAAWKSLKFTTNFGLDVSNENESTKFNRENGNAAGIGRLTKEYARTNSYTWNQLLNYEHSWGEHSLDALVGHEFYGYKTNYINAERTGFPFNEFDDLALGSTISQGYSASEEYYINSYLSRLNYNYADRYYLSGSFRTDASSRFKKENRWGTFWSLGGNWRISEEEFMKGIDWIDNLSLKVSYGVQGNDNIGSYYAWQSLYSMQYANASHSGATISSLENQNVTWESNGNLNAGIGFRLFNRLSGEVEFYNRTTTDMLLAYPLAPSVFAKGYYANVGSMVNRGVDVSLSYDVISKKDTRWTVTLLASTLKNKIKSLAGGEESIVSGYFINKNGLPINSFYMAKSAGVNPVTGEQLYWAYKKDENNRKIEGSDYITEDNTVAANCKYVLGSRIPKVYGSINSSFTWRELDFSVLMTYSLGGKVFDAVYQSMMEPSFVGQTYHTNILRSWTTSGQFTDVPRVTTTNTTTTNDRYLVDASYFAVKNISVGYNLTDVFNRKPFEQLRIYLSYDSPLIWTHLKGMDPQASFSGSTSYTYTPTKSLTLGIEIKM